MSNLSNIVVGNLYKTTFPTYLIIEDNGRFRHFEFKKNEKHYPLLFLGMASEKEQKTIKDQRIILTKYFDQTHGKCYWNGRIIFIRLSELKNL